LFAIAAVGARRTRNLFRGSSGTGAPHELIPRGFKKVSAARRACDAGSELRFME
jgi:hypothetical protein